MTINTVSSYQLCHIENEIQIFPKDHRILIVIWNYLLCLKKKTKTPHNQETFSNTFGFIGSKNHNNNNNKNPLLLSLPLFFLVQANNSRVEHLRSNPVQFQSLNLQLHFL